MDYQPTQTSTNGSNVSTSTMPSAALIVSIVGIFCSLIPILGTICPSIGITLALLSRGKETKTVGKSKAALILGVIGLILTCIVTVALICYSVTHVDMHRIMEKLQTIQTDATYM